MVAQEISIILGSWTTDKGLEVKCFALRAALLASTRRHRRSGSTPNAASSAEIMPPVWPLQAIKEWSHESWSIEIPQFFTSSREESAEFAVGCRHTHRSADGY
jgi:hypothetical protein